MNREQLQAVLVAHSKPELSTVHGMVLQVWNDGEVTCQKCGDLLWQRSLHLVNHACIPQRPDVLSMSWGGTIRDGMYAYIYTDQAGCDAGRAALKAFNNENDRLL